MAYSMQKRYALLCALLVTNLAPALLARQQVQLAAIPRITPDGKTLVFNWNRDVWVVPVSGGRAEALTSHPGEDHWPVITPDGQQVVFQSSRNGYKQLFKIPLKGGLPQPVSFHTEGLTPNDVFPDGRHVLASGWRDYGGLIGERLFKINIAERKAEQLVFDAYAKQGALSPDGKQILFAREGENLYRKGYRGSKAMQIWRYDVEQGTYELMLKQPGGVRSPLWRPDGKAFYFVGAESGSFNIWEYDLETKASRQLTFFEDASVILPGISRNGKTIVFRHLFDFYRFDPTSSAAPAKIDIWVDDDVRVKETRRRYYNSIWNNDTYGSLDWTEDGLEMVFTAGGDLWVMDTVLTEPRLVCGETATHETEAVWAPDRSCIYFLRDEGHRANIWKATREDESKHWWQNRRFKLEAITDTDTSKIQLDVSPDGKQLIFAENRRELMICDTDGKNRRRLYHAVDTPYYSWSPDGKWISASFKDSFDNWDVWIVSTTGEREPYNLSRHPNYDADAVWSPDGKIIAFVGERGRTRDLDIFYVYLRKEDHEASSRDRSIHEAIDAMKNVPLSKVEDESGDSSSSADTGRKGSQEATGKDIDFDGLFERVKRITIAGARESNLFWSHDSKALAFRAKIDGKDGTYKVHFPNNFKPEHMTSYSGYYPKWIKEGNKILWLVSGAPAQYTKKLSVKCYQETHLRDYQRLAFRMIWRQLKDTFYDEHFNNKDWDALRLKYEDAAANAPDSAVFSRVVGMLEGELNASHTGFRTTDGKYWKKYSTGEGWSIRTANIGLHFDPAHTGPGLKVNHVLPGGPADLARSHVLKGETVLAIDGVDVQPGMDLTQVLNGPYERDIFLQVRNEAGEEREVVVRPIGYDAARDLVREEWIDTNRKKVEEASDNKLAYLHVDQMMWPEFERFEQEIFALGYGKDGFVIDVRNNRGGVTADHLLMILNRNFHAYTKPRGGEVSYPRGYLAFTSWDKPIVVLLNQYTGSNGEIFSHAIKTLKRGKSVGVPTQGGVISMPTKQILDFGKLSIPRRGWFVAGTGEDMEMNGAVPDFQIWPHAGDIPAGKDIQLDKAIEVLKQDVADWKTRERPPLKWARER